MSKKSKDTYYLCYRCGKWITLEEADKNYNEYKTPLCNVCIIKVKNTEQVEALKQRGGD